MSGLRAAFGLFSVVPVGRVDLRAGDGRRAVLWLPAVGAVLGGAAAGAALLVRHGGHGSALLAGAVVVAVLALLTRGLHLDGLADLADGLGSGRPAEDALALMRRGDVGPFGVLVLVLTLVLQVAALAAVLGSNGDPLGVVLVVVAAVVGRLAVLWSAGRGVPAARPDGFGALAAGSLTPGAQAAVTLVAAAVAGVAAWAAGASGADLGWLGAAAVVGLAAAWLVRRQAVRRLGGVSGDVFGALVEIATTVALLVLAAQGAWR